jgi:hypothetical protein
LQAEAGVSHRSLQLICVSTAVMELLQLLDLAGHFGPPPLVLT